MHQLVEPGREKQHQKACGDRNQAEAGVDIDVAGEGLQSEGTCSAHGCLYACSCFDNLLAAAGELCELSREEVGAGEREEPGTHQRTG